MLVRLTFLRMIGKLHMTWRFGTRKYLGVKKPNTNIQASNKKYFTCKKTKYKYTSVKFNPSARQLLLPPADKLATPQEDHCYSHQRIN